MAWKPYLAACAAEVCVSEVLPASTSLRARCFADTDTCTSVHELLIDLRASRTSNAPVAKVCPSTQTLDSKAQPSRD